MRLIVILMLCISFESIAQPKITLTETTIDVGEILEGLDYDLTWHFKNAGDSVLEMGCVKTSGSILTGEYAHKRVSPGAESKITGKLTTTGWGGQPFRKSLLVQSNSKEDILLVVKGFIREAPIGEVQKPASGKTSFSNTEELITQASGATSYNVQPGDILFQDLDCGAACDAIESVTEGANGMDFSHCGIVVQMGNEMMVVEAYGAVKVTPVDSFLMRSKDAAGKPKVLIGRLKDESILADESAEIAKGYVGKEYDESFDLKNDKYYCSELVYECFKVANKNKPFFQLNKMTFKAPRTEAIMPFWMDYFKKLDKAVPEGKPGINPGAMSRSDKLQIIALQSL
ncbi:MAG: hypothetical protein K0R82_262 [Flavipsychrobacter sp.]|nr:hypothetical protein [Flavipsychrobacter sp.]